MSAHVDDGNLLSEMGWEEVIQASTAHLLRTCLSRKSKDVVVSTQTVIDTLENVDKLKK